MEGREACGHRMTPLDPSHAEEVLGFRAQFLWQDLIAADEVEAALKSDGGA